MAHAEPGDIIIVRDGIYEENVKIEKSLTIKSENGPKNCILKAKDKRESVFSGCQAKSLMSIARKDRR